ncbi:MAG TPA: LytTR family DNA-binding domain-containing protein [Opitutaceae bacterium]
MSALRVLIIDDEPLARDRLRALVKAEPNLELVAEYTNGPEAIAGIVQHGPELIFIDVEMPGCNGLQVVQALPAHLRPAVLFVTAHDRFAVEAFAVQAVDYLLKPFDRERFRTAVKRAEEYIKKRALSTETATGAANPGSTSPAKSATPGKKGVERLAVKVDGRVVFVSASEIRWVEAADNYVILHLEDRRLMVRDTLSSIEEQLGDPQFTRVNRSAIVRVDQVRELHPTFHGDYVVILRDGTKLPLSRSLRGQVERFTGRAP